MAGSVQNEISRLIAKHEVVVVVGTGVSIGATALPPDQESAVSWRGLLRNGVSYCEQRIRNLPAGWALRARNALDNGDIEEVLGIAEQVTTRLGGPESGTFADWLEQSVGQLTVRNSSTIRGIISLGCPIVTTNYDNLLCAESGLPPILVNQHAQLDRLARGGNQGILHLHGHWATPESVVLGIRSYEQIYANADIQARLRTLMGSKSLLFIGCGDGLLDPHLGPLLRWHQATFRGSPYWHYVLGTSAEVERLGGHLGKFERLHLETHGDNHDALPSFLHRLRGTDSLEVDRSVTQPPPPATERRAAVLIPQEPQKQVKSTGPRRVSVRDRNFAFPTKLAKRLEKLTRERARAPGGEAPNITQKRLREIDEIVSQIVSQGSPRFDDVVVGVKLARIVGKGAFGVVWQGTDVTTGESRAVKVFDIYRLAVDLALIQFRKGIRAMRHLNEQAGCPESVIRLYQVDPSGLAFSMNYVDGHDLSNIRKRGWTFEKKISVFAKICEAVEFAHRNGVVHRDIKPQNIVMTSDLLPVLTDFDIADLQFVMTMSVGATGAVKFAAPEQLDGQRRGTPAVDIYSLGRLLQYLLLEEEPELSFESVPKLTRLVARSPEYVIKVVRKCTMRSPERRYRDVATLLADLRTGVSSYGASAAENEAVGGKFGGVEVLNVATTVSEGDGSEVPNSTLSANTSAKVAQARRYRVPSLTRRTLLGATVEFDSQHRGRGRWANWENNSRHGHCVQFEGRLYPVKMLISLATGMPVKNFSGGDEANRRIVECGFDVVALRHGIKSGDAND